MSDKKLKATFEEWSAATAELRARGPRNNVGESREQAYIRDYKHHLSKVFVGKSVLDVGCGAQFLKTCLPEGVVYHGMDAFPTLEMEATTLKMSIESEMFSLVGWHETICAFAVMDNCLDFDKAISNMKQIATKNIVFLTGVDIEIDKFHTFKLSLNDFDERFADWTQGYREMVAPQVWLLEYLKP